MNSELVSKKTRNEFREFLVGWTLREIEAEFDAANISCDRQFEPQVSGQRRSLVEQYYHSLDFTNPSDVRKLLQAYENVLNTARQRAYVSQGYVSIHLASMIESLAEWLRKDGFRYENNEIIPITPGARKVFEEGDASRTISEVTRRNIFDELRVAIDCVLGPEYVVWHGRLDEIEFLKRIFDLDALPSKDPRMKNAREDIWQHRYNNNDWGDDWVFFDERFNLLKGPDHIFLEFLCEMVHPVVRSDTADATRLVELFNRHLDQDGWEIVEKTRVSGRPVFAARRKGTKGAALNAAKSVASALDSAYISQQITRMETSIGSDPELAIGTAKEFVETVCKTILHECGEAVSKGADLPQLVKQVRERLELLPDSVPEKSKGAEVIKRLLNNLGTVAQGIAELRGLYGSGHGKDAKVKGLQSRHARLAVNAATTLGVFIFDTYQERRGNK